MSATTRRRPPAAEAHGACRWVEPLGPNDSAALLEINGVPYVLCVLEDERTSAVLGYQMVKADGTRYEIDAATWECNCPDMTFRPDRPGGCKHVKALRAALAQLPQHAA